jgi:uncharacterized protein (DUF427 family)
MNDAGAVLDPTLVPYARLLAMFDIARPWAEPAGPNQESVWSYPRPAIAEASARRLRIVHRRVVVADTTRGVRTLETSHPPTYYFPLDDVDARLLRPTASRSFCEWKGDARYYDVSVEDETLSKAAWTYPNPTPPFVILKDHVAFYAEQFDVCTVDGEQVTPQPGGIYGGWITRREVGPFKGGPGTRLW